MDSFFKMFFGSLILVFGLLGFVYPPAWAVAVVALILLLAVRSISDSVAAK